jgi:hypothetical protein
MAAKPGIMEVPIEAQQAESDGATEFAALLQKPRRKAPEPAPEPSSFALENAFAEELRMQVRVNESRRIAAELEERATRERYGRDFSANEAAELYYMQRQEEEYRRSRSRARYPEFDSVCPVCGKRGCPYHMGRGK